MTDVFWSEAALAEYCDALRYIAADDPAAARRVVERIERTIAALADLPSGRRGRVPGTYEQVVAGLPYIIAYSLDETPAGDRRLNILRIIHGARDWPAGGWPKD